MKGKKERIVSLLVTLCMILTMAVPAGVWADTKNDDIVILYTNDVHTYIDGELSYDVLAGMKSELEKNYNHVLLVDAGDHIQGTAYGSMDKGKTIINLMNAAGYDVATLGNHEFDYGMDGRIAVTDQWAAFPYISCNFYEEAGGVVGDTVLDATKTFEDLGKWDVKFVGITTPESFTKSTPAYFQDANGNYIYGIAGGEDGQALYDSVQSAIGMPEDDDIVIGLGHLGDDPSSKPWTSEETIANTSGFDAFIDGHSHSTVEGKAVADKSGEEVWLTQTGEYFDNIGMMVIDDETGEITTDLITAEAIAWDAEENPTAWKLVSDLYTGDAWPVDTDVKAIKDKWMADIDEQLGTVIGKAEVKFDNYDAEGNRLVRKQGTNTGAFAADALYYLFDNMDMDVDVAVMNGGGVRNKAITGPISYKTCKEIHTFGNVACLQTVTGQQILDALEMGAKDYPNENGGFLHPSGLTYDIDISVVSTVQKDDKGVWLGGPTGEYRVKNVEVYNKETGEYEPIDLEANYNLAGYNYTLRDLGDGFAMFDGAVNVLDYVMEDYLVLANYVQSFPNGTITAENSPYGEVTGDDRIELFCGHDYGRDAVCAACGDAPALTDAQKASWAAYYNMNSAFEGDDLDALKAAADAYTKANEEGNMDMTSLAALEAMDEDLWSVAFATNVVITASGYYDAYVADKNAKTAYDFVEYYGMEDVAPFKADIERFMPDIEAVYAEAQDDMPSEGVISVYEAYLGIQAVLQFGSLDEDAYAAVEAFEAVTDTFNELTDEEFEDLAALLGAEDGEAAWNQILGDWVTLNIIMNVDAAYQAYVNEPNAENAQALVDLYDSIFNDPTYSEAGFPELIREFLPGIDDVYAEAKAQLAEDLEEPEGPTDSAAPVDPEDSAETGNAEEPDEAPGTGDQTPVALWLSVLMLAAVALAGMKTAGRKE